jgi:murein DD-endopeptidase MepM/ murein hydrolase activator NlpD
MNVILVSNRWAASRSIYLGGKQFGLLLLLLFGLMAVAVIGVQSVLLRFAPDDLAQALKGRMPVRLSQQVYERGSLDTLAVKLGEMQARVQRLDALGGRLVKLTGMKPSEFQFDQPPAQGGPLVTLGSMSSASLAQQLDALTRVVADRSDKLVALETLLMQNQLSQALLPSSAPVRNGVYTSNFGWRLDPFTGRSAMHEGVDFMAEAGTSILASAGGVVVYADTHPQYGNMVEIDHGNDIVTRYAHASKLLVKVGQVVRRGDKIAEVGSTGRSTGNHLHFEVRYKGIAQNPVRFLQAG